MWSDSIFQGISRISALMFWNADQRGYFPLTVERIDWNVNTVGRIFFDRYVERDPRTF